MTSDASSSPQSAAGRPTSDAPTGSPHSGGALRFVAVFVVVVLSLLTAYRYAVDTAANDWYLFQVARHTSWVLNFVGYRADLEKTTGSGLNPAVVRAALRGEAVRQMPPIPGLESPDAQPLTPWEVWRYRAAQNRNDPAQTRVIGPQVLFILKPGISHQIEALERRLSALQPEDSSEATALNNEIQALRQAQTESLADPGRRRAQQGRFFSFIVVPECGAIEVMVIFLAAVLAFPATWRSRAWGLGLGLPVMYGVNIARLSCLALIGAVDQEGKWFEFCHEYVWQAVYVVFVVVVWMAWVEFRVRREVK